MSDGFALDIEGLEELMAAMGHAPELVRRELGRASDAALLSTVARLKEYPPAPVGSTYVRTRLLGRTWTTATPTFETIASGFEGRLGNNTPYGRYVQGDRQARAHRGRWLTAEQALERNRGEIEAYFEAAGERILARIADEVGG